MITLGIVVCFTALILSLYQAKTDKSVLCKVIISTNICLVIAFVCILMYMSHLINVNTKYQDNINNCYQNICSLKEQYEKCGGLGKDSYKLAVDTIVNQAIKYTDQLYKDDEYKRLINPFHKGEHELFNKFMNDIEHQEFNIVYKLESEEI